MTRDPELPAELGEFEHSLRQSAPSKVDRSILAAARLANAPTASVAVNASRWPAFAGGCSVGVMVGAGAAFLVMTLGTTDQGPGSASGRLAQRSESYQSASGSRTTTPSPSAQVTGDQVTGDQNPGDLGTIVDSSIPDPARQRPITRPDSPRSSFAESTQPQRRDNLEPARVRAGRFGAKDQAPQTLNAMSRSLVELSDDFVFRPSLAIPGWHQPSSDSNANKRVPLTPRSNFHPDSTFFLPRG